MEQKRKTPGSQFNVSVRVSDGFLALLDSWRREQLDPPTRSTALRRLAEHALERLRRPPVEQSSEVKVA